MLRFRFLLMVLFAGLVFSATTPVLAQNGSPSSLTISTDYPSMIIGIGETVSLNMKVNSPSAETISLDTANLPKGWTAEFRGSGKLIRSVYIDQDASSTVSCASHRLATSLLERTNSRQSPRVLRAKRSFPLNW